MYNNIIIIGKDENVFSNLRQYGLGDCYLDVLVADAAKCVWRQGELFDAIITDRELYINHYTHSQCSSSLYINNNTAIFPGTAPYGIREGRRKLGSKNVTPNPIPPELYVLCYMQALACHYPCIHCLCAV